MWDVDMSDESQRYDEYLGILGIGNNANNTSLKVCAWPLIDSLLSLKIDIM